MKTAILSLLLLFSAKSQAKTLVRVQAIGASPRGQFVAFEEYGYLDKKEKPFSRIRVMNVWKNKYVDQPIYIIESKDKMQLDQVRAKAKKLAIQRLKDFNIST